MKEEGPQIEVLLARLAECPAEMRGEPKIGDVGDIALDAIVHDLLLGLGGRPPAPAALTPFASRDLTERNWFRVVLVAAWLLHDRWFRDARRFAEPAARCFGQLRKIAGLVEAEQLVSDPDRREELARTVLAALGLRPKGETEAQAADRLGSLDSVERDRVVKAARGKLQKARELEEARKKKEAEEAAARYGRE